jgi:predicted nucleic acid-binding protein
LKRRIFSLGVFISLINKELDSSVRGLFVEAENFFFRVAERGDMLVLSNLFMKEVSKVAFQSEEDVFRRIEFYKIKYELIKVVQKDLVLEKEFNLKGLHYPDSLHATVAINNFCDAIVAFNKKDFESLSGDILVYLPEEL